MMKIFKYLVLVGMLIASAGIVKGDIIWSGLEDAHIFMAPNDPGSPEISPGSVNLDMDGNGVIDFAVGILEPDVSLSRYLVACSGVNSVARGGQYDSSIIPFSNGELFDASGTWLTEGSYQDSEVLTQWMILIGPGEEGAGPWAGMTGYMGVQFESGDGMHFGWVHMTVYAEYPGMTIHSWAYETTPGEGIIAGAVPEPATVLLFGLGGLSVYFLRRSKAEKADTRGP